MVGLRILVACLFALVAGNALGQSFPSKPITMICPCPPSPETDQFLATLARIASRHIGQPIIAESAGQLLPGLERIARKAPPDGYLISILPMPALRLPHTAIVNWDPIKDFTYIIGIASNTIGIVVKSDSQFKSILDVIEYAKANPGRFSYGALPRGTTPHLAMEDLGLKGGARFMHVPGTYAESAKALIDGRVMAISDTTVWVPHVDAGTFRLIATLGEKRSRWNAPTARELGLDVLAYSPFGIIGPKGIDPRVIKILHDAFNRALDDPEYDKALRRLDLVDWYKSSEDFTEWAIDQFRFQRGLIERTIGLGRN